MTENNNGSAGPMCIEGQNSCNDLELLLGKVNNGDTIMLTGHNVYLARGQQGAQLDNKKLDINKQVTINGGGNTLKINANDINLGADVEINNVNLQAQGYSRTQEEKNEQVFSNNATDTSNIYLNGYKLTLNAVTTNDTRNNIKPNIILGSSAGKVDEKRGELMVTNSTPDTKFANVVAGSHTGENTGMPTVKISIDKDIIQEGGKIYLGNGENKAPTPTHGVSLTIHSGSLSLIKKIDQNGVDNADITLKNVSAGSGKIPVNKLANLTLNGSEVTLENTEITGTLSLENGSTLNIENPNTTSLGFSDESESVSVTINNVTSKDTTSKISVLNPKINLTISNFTGSTLPKLSERDAGESIISLPNGYNSQTDRAGNITITPPSSTTETVEPAPSPAPAPATPPKTEEPKQNEPSPKPSEGEQSSDQNGEVNEQGQNNNNSSARSENQPEHSDSSASNSSSASGSSNNDSPTGQGGDGATMQPNAGAGTPSTTPEANPDTSQPNGSSPSGSETPAGSKETENQSGSDTGQDDQATRQEDP
ncbi:hypothetical protein GVX81_09870, partial [[Haemophilus] felis]|nr:hypothetical protein [[Haemophilus] felis]